MEYEDTPMPFILSACNVWHGIGCRSLIFILLAMCIIVHNADVSHARSIELAQVQDHILLVRVCKITIHM